MAPSANASIDKKGQGRMRTTTNNYEKTKNHEEVANEQTINNPEKGAKQKQRTN